MGSRSRAGTDFYRGQYENQPEEEEEEQEEEEKQEEEEEEEEVFYRPLRKEDSAYRVEFDDDKNYMSHYEKKSGRKVDPLAKVEPKRKNEIIRQSYKGKDFAKEISTISQENIRETKVENKNRVLYRVLIFTWNTDEISFCSNYDNSNPAHKEGKCVNPDFVAQLMKVIKEEKGRKIDIISLCLQESLSSNLVFLKNLQEEMKKIGYMTVDPVITNSFFARTLSKGSNQSLLFFREELQEILLFGKRKDPIWCGEGVRDVLIKDKGAVVMLAIDKKESFGMIFVNAQLPFSRSDRTDSLAKQNACVKRISYQINIVKKELVERYKLKSTAIFMAGDLSYQIARNSDQLAGNVYEELGFKEYFQLDELDLEMRLKRIPVFQESEVLFNPTCTLLKSKTIPKSFEQRNFRKYKYGKYSNQMPSYCDRILYQEDKVIVESKVYDTLDYGYAALQSDHSPVYAIMDIKEETTIELNEFLREKEEDVKALEKKKEYYFSLGYSEDEVRRMMERDAFEFRYMSSKK